jgi:tetratricopeptide (TPR) repeat protein
MVIDALNQKNHNDPFLVITNKPARDNSWRMQQYRDRIAVETAILKTDPKDERAYLNRAIYYALDNKFNESIQDYDQVISLDPHNLLAYFGRATARLLMTDYIQSLNTLPEPETINIGGKKAGQDDTQKTHAQVLDYEKVIKDYETVIYMNPKFIFAWFNMGNTKVKERDYYGALDDYSKAIELEPDFAEAYFNRGLTRIYLDDIDGGALDLSKAGELGIDEAYSIIKQYCN